MALVLTVALGAFLVGRLAGGTLPRLLSVRPRSARLLVVTVGIQAAGGLVALVLSPAYGVATAVSGIFVAVFAVRNRSVPGVPLVAAGLLCNVLVVLANGAMPVSVEAAGRAGLGPVAADLAESSSREPLTEDTRLGLLAARIPVALPPHSEVATAGNVMVASGVALFLVTGMNQPRRRMAPSRRRLLVSSADGSTAPVASCATM